MIILCWCFHCLICESAIMTISTYYISYCTVKPKTLWTRFRAIITITAGHIDLVSSSDCIDKCSPCRLVGCWLSNACRVVGLSDSKCHYVYKQPLTSPTIPTNRQTRQMIQTLVSSVLGLNLKNWQLRQESECPHDNLMMSGYEDINMKVVHRSLGFTVAVCMLLLG